MKPKHNHVTLKARRSGRRGAVFVESAIVLGIFAAIMLGFLDLGLAILRQNSLDATARQVARAAVVRGQSTSSVVEGWGPARYASRGDEHSEIAATARQSLVTIDPQDVLLVVTWPDGGNQPEQRVRVRIRYRHVSLFPMLYGKQLRLQSECIMRIAH